MKILHITESFGGGVTSAINSYVANSNQFEHYLFATVREQDSTGEEGSGNFKEIFLVQRDFNALKKLRNLIAEINPDVVHLHSTFAGFICRCLPFLSAKKIVYTPHGYAFLRNDGFIKTRIYFLIELLLSFRTKVIAGCSAHECFEAKKIKSSKNVFELVNVCDDLSHLEIEAPENIFNKKTIAMVGRLVDQKGYQFFLTVAEALKSEYQFLWIGGGELKIVEKMEQANVFVTGWLERKDVIRYMKNIDIYFHTAAWEGFPISVLEAAKFEKPIMLRAIGSFTHEDLNVVSSTDEAIEQLLSLKNNDDYQESFLTQNIKDINHRHSSETLKNAILKAYEKVIGVS